MFICLRPRTQIPPPPPYTCIQYTYSHREVGMEGESRTREKVRGQKFTKFANITDCISSQETLINTCRKVPLQVPVSSVRINGWYKLIDWNIRVHLRYTRNTLVRFKRRGGGRKIVFAFLPRQFLTRLASRAVSLAPGRNWIREQRLRHCLDFGTKVAPLFCAGRKRGAMDIMILIEMFQLHFYVNKVLNSI